MSNSFDRSFHQSFAGGNADQSKIVDSFVEAAKSNEHQPDRPTDLKKNERSSEFRSVYNQLKAAK